MILSGTSLKSHLLFTLFLSLYVISGKAQDSKYSISCSLSNYPDSSLYLAHYYGKDIYMDDTASLFSDKFLFQGDSLLDQGVYLLVSSSKQKIIDFLVDDSQQFSISVDQKDPIHHTSFEHSEENQLFSAYIKKKVENFTEINKINARITKKKTLSQDSLNLYASKKIQLQDEIDQMEDLIIEKHPSWLLSSFILALRDPDMQDIKAKTDNQTKLYQYYKNHYWENINLSDGRLIRTPIFHKKLVQFFDKVVYQQTDSLISSIDFLIQKIPDQEIFKYVVWYLTYEYANSKIMGFDAIFVHMIDTYYAKGRAYWADSSVVASVVDKANKLRRVLIGNTAPEMVIIDTLGNLQSMHAIPGKWTLLFFYDPDCGHCKKETQVLKKWTDTTNIELNVIAINSKKDKKKWEHFISTYQLDSWYHLNGMTSATEDFRELYNIKSYPETYLLDRQKKIIAKEISIAQIKELIERLDNYDMK